MCCRAVTVKGTHSARPEEDKAMNTINRTRTTLALALALALAGTASAAPAQQTQTGSLIPVPLQTVVVSTPSMAAIRAIAIQPIARIADRGWSCEIIGAVYSDNALVADGPMPHVRTSLRAGGKTVYTRTNSYGVYHVVVPAGPRATTWHEARPAVGELPFGVHPSRPSVVCPAA